MGFLISLIRVVLFLVLLAFALANTHPVQLTLIPGVSGMTFEAPMVVWLLAIFTAGVLAAFLFLLPTLVRGWRKHKDGN
jgi:uncharacterized integral membrane protein